VNFPGLEPAQEMRCKPHRIHPAAIHDGLTGCEREFRIVRHPGARRNLKVDGPSRAFPWPTPSITKGTPKQAAQYSVLQGDRCNVWTRHLTPLSPPRPCLR
jgi:hypothetical protein